MPRKTRHLTLRQLALGTGAALCVLAGSVHAQTVDGPAQFGGPSSVGADLTTRINAGRIADALHLGFDYSVMLQSATEGSGLTEAAGGVARFFGTAGLYQGNAGTGSLTFKIENRHRLSDEIAPQDLGFAVGYVGLTSLTFSEADWLLTNLYWQHSSPDNRWSVVVGVLDVTDYVDVYALGNPWAEFSNLTFSTNPTIPAPNQGIGIAGRYLWNDRLYVVAGFADANGDPGRPEQAFESAFKTGEFFYHAEIGLIGSYADRFSDNLHLTVWKSDARRAAGVTEGRGAALSASWRWGEAMLPFFRAGWSEGGGALLTRAVSAGLGYETGREDDRWAIGLNWGQPSGDFGNDPDPQITAEAYWRFRLFDRFEFTPDVQFISNPALDPTVDSLWIFGLRARATF